MKITVLDNTTQASNLLQDLSLRVTLKKVQGQDALQAILPETIKTDSNGNIYFESGVGTDAQSVASSLIKSITIQSKTLDSYTATAAVVIVFVLFFAVKGLSR
jgi:hypothetical protein